MAEFATWKCDVSDLEVTRLDVSEFSWRETTEFLKFATEVAAVDIAQLRSNLFYA